MALYDDLRNLNVQSLILIAIFHFGIVVSFVVLFILTQPPPTTKSSPVNGFWFSRCQYWLEDFHGITKTLLLVNFLCNYGLMQYYESLGWLSYNRTITSWHILKFKCSRKHVEKGSVLVKTVLDLSPPSQKCAKSKPLYQVFILAKNVWVGLDYPSWSDKFDILLMHALS